MTAVAPRRRAGVLYPRLRTKPPGGLPRPTAPNFSPDEPAGGEWWNRLSEFEQTFWLRQSPANTVAEAWAAFNRPRYSIEQLPGSNRAFRSAMADASETAGRIWKVDFIEAGVVLRATECRLTFDNKPNYSVHQIGDTTARLVVYVVEDCALHNLSLSLPDRLGRRIGRSGKTARRALNALHDDGRLTLRQRDMRRVAELPASWSKN